MITRRSRAYELGRRLVGRHRRIVPLNIEFAAGNREQIERAFQLWLDSWIIPDVDALLDGPCRSEFQRGMREAANAHRPLGPRPEAAS